METTPAQSLQGAAANASAEHRSETVQSNGRHGDPRQAGPLERALGRPPRQVLDRRAQHHCRRWRRDASGASGPGVARFDPPRRAGTTTTTTCGVVSVARERRCVPRALRDVREVEVVGGGRRGPGRKPNEMAIGVGKANLFLPINFSPSLWLALKSNLDGNPT